ncbi:MAG TPA: hypothetical protein VF070_09675 [Streptosporangiaceae bacterium]
MKQVHRLPVGAAARFKVVNGTPPGPTDPAIVEFPPPPQLRRAGNRAPCRRAVARPARYCRVTAR